jgi:predicted nuclease of predicted toxin-antitoxin system
MSLQIVVDMNLSPDWVANLAAHGWSAVHWSAIGPPSATDAEIMAWAIANQYVVFTHDLDFGTALALTHATGPSVLQVRGQDVLAEDIGPAVLAALRQFQAALEAGALVVVDWKKSRARASILGDHR